MKIANIAGIDSGRPRESAATRGNLSAAGLRFAIVVSEFNGPITDRLLAGALDAFSEAGVSENQLEIVRVPGSFEIPVAARKLAASGRFDALVCIGCIVRGETPHFEYVAAESARGIQLAQLDTGVPMAFCVLTCDTIQQAIERAGLKGDNKGYESALGAVEMARLFRNLSKNSAAPGRTSGKGRAPRAPRPRARARSRRR